MSKIGEDLILGMKQALAYARGDKTKAKVTVFARLQEPDFRRLVAGQTVSLQTTDGREINLILADIGWERMTRAIAVAMGSKNRTPE